MHFLFTGLPVALSALIVEAGIGYPSRLFDRIGHPVTWIGAAIAALEKRLNDPACAPRIRRWRGVLALLMLVAVVAGFALALDLLSRWAFGVWAVLPLGVLASSLVAQRSLSEHVARVAEGLDIGIDEARRAVSHIVGRDPRSLDEAAVVRAAIESLAENFSDGIVAPAFYTALGGIAGGAVYKAVNTADSMIGHRSLRYEAYGWSAARLDDWMNLPASRLSACLLVLAAALVPGCSALAALEAVVRDARRHRSPNAGWPEAAMAGALSLRLAGPRTYDGLVIEDHWMGEGTSDATQKDIRRALTIYKIACVLQGSLLALLLLIVIV
ncbi:adenosylcobinamide-phosphate synthase CbiB [Microvirga puerhi]|uniref:Cobalamin biosynthesis protein CobD n=1 Tax=Microvirga puerhi TaxID=2876078 RepID=A0ABS7VPX9_9HYPH|nr:adenosylcobinamide-phosphate synthase CbiB [Microvirga puerhi]MBZ6077259.1 adenosylcobinamide-phosphate synthase CbiB [Microvirga puerhi]